MNAMVTSRKRERGQSLVELVLVLPFLLLLLLGIVDLGRVFNAYIAITNASREGAVFGSTYPPAGDPVKEAVIRMVVLQELRPTVMLNPALIQITSIGSTPGSPVTVTVQYPFSAVSLIMESFLPGGNPFMLTATTVMMVRE
jgi:Flp pilus assembly protein TadG